MWVLTQLVKHSRENWHNFHHAFPSDYRNGHKLYHFDLHKWIINLLEKLGLAWNVVRAAKKQIQARVNYIKNEWRQLPT